MQLFTSWHCFRSKKIQFDLQAAHGRREGVNSNQPIMRAQRAGFFPNKTNPVTSFQVIRNPLIPPKSTAGLWWRSSAQNVVFFEKESTFPDLHQTSQRVVSRGELGSSLSRTIASGRAGQHQQFSINVNIEPTPSRKQRLFYPHQVCS